MINKVMYRKIGCDILRVCFVNREIGEGEEWSRRVRERRVRERRQIPSLVGYLEMRDGMRGSFFGIIIVSFH